MFCQKCGEENKDGSAFCNSCGVVLVPISAQPPTQSKRQNDVIAAKIRTREEQIKGYWDEEFLMFLDDNNITQRIESLSLHGCNIVEAEKINQLIFSNKKPDNSTLVKRRDYLISATTYCQAPEKPARDQSQTKADLDKFSSNLNEYVNGLAGCSAELDKVRTAQEDLGNGEGSTFHRSSDDVQSFNATGDGIRIFAMLYSGSIISPWS